MDNPEIPRVLESLLSTLGKITLTCTYDTGNKPIDSKSLVLLTQSHSSTLAQEIVSLLRHLHGILGWNQALNSILVQKLNFAAYYLLDSGILALNEGTSSLDAQHYLVVAAMNVIGAWDVRPRIGGVVEVDGMKGTIVKVTQKGKFGVQLFQSGEMRKVGFGNLKLLDIPRFNFDRMPLNESLVKVWASLLMNKQSGQSEKRPVHGVVNLSYLRTQQNTLSALNAIRILHTNHLKLRKILKQPLTLLEPNQTLDDDGDDPNQQQQPQPALLIQSVLSRAAQASPLKPTFTFEEMHLAALNLSQYLAAEGASGFCKQQRVASPVPPAPPCTSGANNDNAAAAECLGIREAKEVPTPTSECSVKSVVSEKAGKRRKNEEQKEEVPMNPVVGLIMEMGFTKRAVEFAIETLGNDSHAFLNYNFLLRKYL